MDGQRLTRAPREFPAGTEMLTPHRDSPYRESLVQTFVCTVNMVRLHLIGQGSRNGEKVLPQKPLSDTPGGTPVCGEEKAISKEAWRVG